MSIIITGGNFTQVNNFNGRTPWDRLQAAVAPVALHNSAERFDPSRCHPNTRVAVMDELIDWVIRRGDGGGARVLWLSGPAGAGKSAIAQSLCEVCFSQKFLLASFIFNRSDSSRNNSKYLVATITNQIYGMLPRQYQSLILDAIDNDPLVFDRSIEAQFKALIMDPLHGLFEDDHFNNYDAPRLIVIDGLDECSPRAAQVSILNAVQTISMQRSSPFIFLIASRPEHDIQMFFRSNTVGSSIRRLNLDDSYLPDLDIELFLRDKLQETCATHPLKELIPQGWPTNGTIKELVQKSSGQFIYASVVVKYVTSIRHNPPNRLDIVLGLRPARRDLPFAELDTLYSHILSCVGAVDLILRILRIVLISPVDPPLVEDVEQLCKLDQGECLNALCDLQSVLQIKPPDQTIRLLHKSLSDYLQDPARSRGYYIDTSPRVVISIVIQCFRVMSDSDYYSQLYTDFLWEYRHLLAWNIQICHENLISFSLMDCCKVALRKAELCWDTREFILRCSYLILDGICVLEGTEYEYVYRHYLQQFLELASDFAEMYASDVPDHGINFFPMLAIFVLWGNSEIHIPSKVFDILNTADLQLSSLTDTAMMDLKNLSYGFAWRCIQSLIHNSCSNSAAFALMCLPLVLPRTKLSANLNEACHLLANSLDYTSMRRPLAYDFKGRPYADLGYTGAEIREIAGEFEHKARTAMKDYTERYTKTQI